MLIVVVMIVVVMIIVMILIPVMLGFPPVVSSIPPLVILIPATLPFCVQIASPFLGLVAVLTIFLDRPIESPFRLLDRMLALSSIVVSVRPWCCHKKAKSSRHYRGHGHLSNSSIQGFSFRFAGGLRLPPCDLSEALSRNYLAPEVHPEPQQILGVHTFTFRYSTFPINSKVSAQSAHNLQRRKLVLFLFFFFLEESSFQKILCQVAASRAKSDGQAEHQCAEGNGEGNQDGPLRQA
jgi:hypothetical protein